MADDHAAEPLPGTPGQRALGAMESAVRRARASGGAAPLPDAPPPMGRRPPTRPTRLVNDRLPPADDRRPNGPQRWLVGAVAVVAALVVAAAVALIVSLSSSSGPSGAPAARSAPTRAAPSHSGRANPQGGPAHRATNPTSPSTSPPSSSTVSTPTTTAVAPSGPPALSSLNPANGAAGETITITGTNFLSTTGQIEATFNGQVATTRCPAQNTCTVTVPPSTASSAQVIVTTATGPSNALTFTYN